MPGEVVKGDGWAVAPDLDSTGEGYGFRKLRKELDVTEFGVNLVTVPPGYTAGRHFHEKQQELYFVHRGKLGIEFDDGTKHEIHEGGAVRVDAATVRRISNLSDSEDCQYLAIGAEGGYVGRDGMVPEGEGNPRPGL